MNAPKLEQYFEYLTSLSKAVAYNFPDFDANDFMSFSQKAFTNASNAWDGIRDFKPLLRRCMLNLIVSFLRKEKIRKMREILHNDKDWDKIGTEIQDTREYINPALQAEYNDWLEHLTESERHIVIYITTNKEIRNLPPKKVRGILREYLINECKWTHRKLWETEKSLSEKMMERMTQNA